MQVILTKDVDNVGHKDDLVTVKNGYGRNFLIPNGVATLATESMKKMHEETVKQRSHKAAKLEEEAKAAAAKLVSATIKVGAKVGEGGKIFGSVGSLQVAEAIKAAGFDVDRKGIKIVNEPIKAIGKYEATVKFGKNLTETITFEVVEE
jgi:large subunit ribosomal protein L9